MSDQKGQFARPVYLLGAGKSPFGVLCQNTTSPLGVETDSGADSPLKDMSERELTVTACYNAYEDAGIRARDVEKVVFGNVANFHLGEGIAGSAQFLSWMGCQGKPMTHHEEACATGYVVLGDAIEAVASGQYDIVLAVCYGSAASFYHRYELPYMQHPRNEFTFGDGRFEALWQGNDPAFERWMGASEISPFDMGGYIYMEDYGKTPDEIDDYLNAIAYNERYNAVRNEDAFYHEDFDQIAKKAGFSSGMEYLKSDQNMRISPFSRRLHNLTHLDGAAAAVVCSEKVAKASGKLPIKVLASAFSTVPQYVHRNYQVMNKNVVKALHRKAAEPLNYAMMMLQVGWVDCWFGGVAYTSGDFIAAARGLIGLSEGVRSPSSLGFHYVPGWEGGEDGMVAIGDCSTTIAPTPEQLAGIAIASCDTARTLFGWEPRAAMLSFSTCGSGHHEKADQVREAVGIAHELRPDLAIDGEFQLDAAINPRVAARKVKRESEVAGRANILIFPDINAGNIGRKLMQEFGHSEVACLVMQGFAKPVADCSRGDTPHILANSMACLAARAERGMN